MAVLQSIFDYLIHIDVHLFAFVASYGAWTYLALFLIIFCETGLVVTPFLPGDSLLFAAGSIAANPDTTLDIRLLFISLFLASVFGNKVNYLIGRAFGMRLGRLVNKKHLEETHRFYTRHGGKTIIFARFIPIIRTFAPFVAGISRMSLRQFSFYNLVSAALWIGSLLAAGYYFGSIPAVKAHFTFVIYGIIVVSLLPPTLSYLYHKLHRFARAR